MSNANITNTSKADEANKANPNLANAKEANANKTDPTMLMRPTLPTLMWPH
jgi:hypothetical protein